MRKFFRSHLHLRRKESEGATSETQKSPQENNVPNNNKDDITQIESVHNKSLETGKASKALSTSSDPGSEDAPEDDTVKFRTAPAWAQSPAFTQAWSTLNTQQQQSLKLLEQNEPQSPQDLFVKLSHANDKHRSESWFRSGLEKVAPLLNGLQFCMELATPFVGLEPSASIAFELTKSVTSVSIGLCGASEELSDHICLFLECIPAIDMCDQALQRGGSNKHIQKALSLVYEDLMNFYLEVISILDSQTFLLSLAKSQFQQSLSGIIQSFSAHTDKLRMYIDFETYGKVIDTNVLVEGIANRLDEEKIQKHLSYGRTKEVEFLNRLEKRAEGTCEWLKSAPSFCRWMRRTPPNANMLSMVGNMGCGKTMTIAYVIDQFANRGLGDYHDAVICFYYCNDDGERNKSPNIYRSLLSQILDRRPELQNRFLTWLNEAKSRTTPLEPTQSREELRRFFIDIVSHLKQWLFVIVDALDECDEESCNDILEDCRTLSEKHPRCKIFLSSRHNDDIKGKMSKETVYVQLQQSNQEDHRIAIHLVDRYLPKGKYDEELRQAVIKKVSHDANGCAIWMKMVLEFLHNSRKKKTKLVIEAIQAVPSKLSEVYGKLFDQIKDQADDNGDILEQTLKILAAAYRPLTLRELSNAVTLDLDRNEFTTLSELEERVDYQMVLDIARPFISTEGSENSVVRLVHHSLRELILQQAPATWSYNEKAPNKLTSTNNFQQIQELISKRCLRYLQFPELKKKELFYHGRIETFEIEMTMAGFAFFDDEDEAPSQNLESFNPFQEGFGGFFTYAACYWSHHVRQSSNNASPDAQTLINIATAGSTLLRNWSEQYLRPSCFYSEEEYLPEFNKLDPLVVAAYFDLESTTIQLLEEHDVGSDTFVKNSVWIATECALENGYVSIVRCIFERTGTTMHNFALFHRLCLYGWRGDQDSDKNSWDELFEIIIHRMSDQVIEWGPELLCRAAGMGCLPMVKKLFEIGSKSPTLRQAMLEDRDRKGKRQSVGEAVYGGHTDVVRFLCQQDGIEKHLFHRGANNETVFHDACRLPNPATIRTLLDFYPEGVDLRDDHDDTPLILMVFRNPNACEAVQVLLDVGKVDPNAVNNDGNFALKYPVFRGNTDMTRTLVAGGADVYSVLDIGANGQPELKFKTAYPENEKGILKELLQLKDTAEK